MSFLSTTKLGYSKMDKEDPEEVMHRRAQFLIYKKMQQADFPRKRPSWLKVRATKLKIRIGKRLRRLRKSILSIIISSPSSPSNNNINARDQVGLQKQIISQFKALKRLIVHSPRRRQNTSVNVATLRPIFK
ncbi:OLC1v1021234C1 [Oldenlandia corymbosa var. corymbosa]|uniref:OLC1v1021234C1 n=1 Tax=Oldenlandia corymbosa var. corymbosa TaxID=529605 RepID=A0AAV1BVH5_OLDCO|nr:OLC1v1021234C1 [Oldenlandia corymbosa var. corymbosa]